MAVASLRTCGWSSTHVLLVSPRRGILGWNLVHGILHGRQGDIPPEIQPGVSVSTSLQGGYHFSPARVTSSQTTGIISLCPLRQDVTRSQHGTLALGSKIAKGYLKKGICFVYVDAARWMPGEVPTPTQVYDHKT